MYFDSASSVPGERAGSSPRSSLLTDGEGGISSAWGCSNHGVERSTGSIRRDAQRYQRGGGGGGRKRSMGPPHLPSRLSPANPMGSNGLRSGSDSAGSRKAAGERGFRAPGWGDCFYFDWETPRAGASAGMLGMSAWFVRRNNGFLL